MYNWFTFLYSRSEPTTVNQLYLSKKKKNLSYSNYDETAPPQKKRATFCCLFSSQLSQAKLSFFNITLISPRFIQSFGGGRNGNIPFFMHIYLFLKIN